MLRLTLVFLVWIGSTAYAVENADTEYETSLRPAHRCGVLTEADVHTILPPHEIADGFLGRP
jgi:hypothetical protein